MESQSLSCCFDWSPGLKTQIYLQWDQIYENEFFLFLKAQLLVSRECLIVNLSSVNVQVPDIVMVRFNTKFYPVFWHFTISMKPFLKGGHRTAINKVKHEQVSLWSCCVTWKTSQFRRKSQQVLRVKLGTQQAEEKRENEYNEGTWDYRLRLLLSTACSRGETMHQANVMTFHFFPVVKLFTFKTSEEALNDEKVVKYDWKGFFPFFRRWMRRDLNERLWLSSTISEILKRLTRDIDF